MIRHRVSNPGGQDSYCRPINLNILKFETGLRKYASINKIAEDKAQWKPVYYINSTHNKAPMIKSQMFNDKVAGNSN